MRIRITTHLISAAALVLATACLSGSSGGDASGQGAAGPGAPNGTALDPAPPGAGATADPNELICQDSCVYSNDGECDDGRAGAITDLCDPGSDCGDCGPGTGAGPKASDGVTPGDGAGEPAGPAPADDGVAGNGAPPPPAPEVEPEPIGTTPVEGMPGRDGTPATLQPTLPTAFIPPPTCDLGSVTVGGDLDVLNTPLGIDGTDVTAMTVRFELSTFIGEPLRRSTVAWEGTGGFYDVTWVGEVLSQDGLSHLTTGSGQRIYVAPPIGTIEDAGQGFGSDISGSPSWDAMFVTYDELSGELVLGVTAEEAQGIFEACFSVGNVRVLALNGDPAMEY